MVHINSITAFREERERLRGRKALIYELLSETNTAMTDREVMLKLGYSDPNAVRPRITELIKRGLIEEFDTKICVSTRKTVRRVRKINHEPQGDLFV
jgi:predicted DNA-binding transcriptional regulator